MGRQIERPVPTVAARANKRLRYSLKSIYAQLTNIGDSCLADPLLVGAVVCDIDRHQPEKPVPTISEPAGSSTDASVPKALTER